MPDQDTPIQNLDFNLFLSGFFSNKTKFFAPIDRGDDAVADGVNMLHTDRLIWERRPGFVEYSSTDHGDTALAQTSHSTVWNGSLWHFMDMKNEIRKFKPTEEQTVTKTSGQQSFMVSANGNLYISQVTNSATLPHRRHKLDTEVTTVWGITAPTTAPCITTVTTGCSGTCIKVRVGWKYVYVYKDSVAGHISSASPASEDTLNFNDRKVRICGDVSAEARVDKIEIYRTRDGGSTFFFLQEINNTACSGGGAPCSNACGGGNCVGKWQIEFDQAPDINLNELKEAPINGANDPPSPKIQIVVEHENRLWGGETGVDGNLWYTAHNIDGAVNGVEAESWPPLNNFKFNKPITGLVSTSSGLLVFTVTDTYIITGRSKLEFDPHISRQRIGVASPNCIAADGDIIYLYSTNRQILRISDRVEEIGIPIDPATLSTNFSAADTWLALHRDSKNSALYMSAPNWILRFGLATQTWSTPWTSAKFHTVFSAQTDLTVFDLLVFKASVPSTSKILKLEPTVFQDAGTGYTCRLEWNTIPLASSRSIADLRKIAIESTGNLPTVSILPDEIADDVGIGMEPQVLQTVEPNTPFVGDSVTYLTKQYYTDSLSDPASSRPMSTLMKRVRVVLDWESDNELESLYSLSLGYYLYENA